MKPLSRPRLIRLLHRTLPITRWLPHYNPTWLLYDTLAGLTVGIVVVPQSLALAKVVGLPVQYGLYTSFFAAITYALLGTSKDITMGPTAVLSLLTAQAVAPLVEKGHGVLGSAVVLSFLAGVYALAMWALRLGFLMELISKPVVIGFTSGAAITIIAQQMPSLLGISGVNTRDETYHIIYETVKRIPTIRMADLAMGISCLAALVAVQQIQQRIKTMHPAVRFLCTARNAVLIVAVTLISFLIHRDREQAVFSIIKTVPQGLPKPQIPPFSSEILHDLAVPALVLAMLGILETTAIGKSLGRKNSYRIDYDQEFFAFGIANIGSSFFTAFPSTASFSRSAIQSHSGSRSPFPGLIVGIVVMLALLFLPPVFYYIPQAALPAIIISCVTSLFTGWHTWKQLWAIQKTDCLTAILGFIGTIAFGIAEGVEIAVGFSLLVLLYRLSTPSVHVLAPSTCHPTAFVPEASFDADVQHSGILVFGMKEALLFPNASRFQHMVSKVIKNRVACVVRERRAKDQIWCDVDTLVGSGANSLNEADKDWVDKAKDKWRRWNSRNEADFVFGGNVLGVSYDRNPAVLSVGNDCVNLDPNLPEHSSREALAPSEDVPELIRLRAVVFDFTGINRLDATSLEVLQDLCRWIQQHVLGDGGQVVIRFAGVGPEVWEVLKHGIPNDTGIIYAKTTFKAAMMQGILPRTVKDAVDSIEQEFSSV